MYSKSLLFVCFLNIALLLINCAEAVLERFEIDILDQSEYISVTLNKNPNSYLANENLPVWTMEGNEILPYKNLNVTSNISIIPYFNYEKKAAFIYSRKCNCLYGVIGMKYIIKEFPMNLIINTQIIGASRYIMRRNLTLNKPSNSNRKPIPRTEEELKINERAVNKTLYPEILIVVKNDFYLNWKLNDISHEKMILYIISLMNAADMLYSPSEKEVLKVKLNIAGIIIESEENLLPNIKDYSHQEYLSAESLIRKVIDSKYADFDKSKLNPHMSYDWIFFFTSKRVSYSGRHNLTRMSSYPKNGIVHSRQEGCGSFNTPISIITDDYEFISFPTIAHEAFHLIIRGSHEKVEKSNCHVEFLRTYDDEDLEKFQWSDDCCLLTNKPQSLNFNQPPMNPEKQCQCYGYEKNYFINPTECTEMVTCEDAKKNEIIVPRIVDDEFCRDKWGKEQMQLIHLLYVATSTPSTTTTTVIPPLTKETQCTWIKDYHLANLMFIFPQENKETNDDGLICLATIVEGNNSDEHKLAFTAKSCAKDSIKLRNHLIKTEGETTYAESQSEADFSVTIVSIDNFDNAMASLSPEEGISDNFIKLSNLKNSTEIESLVNEECRLINVRRVASNSTHPFVIEYIPILVSIEYVKGSTSNYVIRSKDPVNESELRGLKGNSLFCRLSNGMTELIGILVNYDDDKHLRFMNIADYKETIQKRMNELF